MTRSAPPQPPQDNPPPADPTVTPPARTDGRSDGLETKKPIKVFRGRQRGQRRSIYRRLHPQLTFCRAA